MNSETKAAIELFNARPYAIETRKDYIGIHAAGKALAAALLASQQIISEQEFIITASQKEVERLTAQVKSWSDGHFVQENRHKAEVERLRERLESSKGHLRFCSDQWYTWALGYQDTGERPCPNDPRTKSEATDEQ